MSESKSSHLVLEVRNQQDSGQINANVSMTPRIGEDYWSYRVRLSDTQAILGFPKFFTIGIGFAQEEDWNTNLPYTCDAREIFEHISHNKGDDSISDEDCIAAIGLVQEAARQAGVPVTAPTETPLFEEFADRYAEAVREDEPVSGDLFDPPTVEFRPVRRGLRRWVLDNLTWKRGLVGGASAFVFLATALGRWFA